MKLGWLSDIHLDHTDRATRATFLQSIARTPVDAWLLGGDIGTASTVSDDLEAIAGTVTQPVYFTLGNHDFYRGSLASVRRTIEDTLSC